MRACQRERTLRCRSSSLSLTIALVGATTVGSSGQRETAQPPLTRVELAVTAAYEREFGEVVARPAIVSNTDGNQCEEPHLATTAYFRTSSSSARLVYLVTTPDGRAVIRKSRVASVVIIPAGTFRVLVVMVRHQATADGADLVHWEAAQAKINRDHAAFAASRGLATPIVSFSNTNLLLDARDIADPKSRSSILAAAEEKGLQTASFQFIVAINIDSARSEGGFAGAEGFVYMGNYGRWSRPLAAAEWVNVANAVYHHEVAHHWGWPGTHDWARCASGPTDSPFIVPPILFGWEDVDGDSVPEILDRTPYGRPE